MKLFLLLIIVLVTTVELRGATTATYVSAFTGFGLSTSDIVSTDPLSTLPGQNTLHQEQATSFGLSFGVDSKRALPLRLQLGVGIEFAEKRLESTLLLPVRTGPNDTTVYSIANDVEVRGSSLFVELESPIEMPWQGVTLSPKATLGVVAFQNSASQNFSSEESVPLELPSPVEIASPATESWAKLGVVGGYEIPVSWEFDVAVNLSYMRRVYTSSELFSASPDNLSIGVSLAYRGEQPDIIETNSVVDTVLVPDPAPGIVDLSDTLRYIADANRVEMRRNSVRIERSPDSRIIQPISVLATVREVPGWDDLTGTNILLPRIREIGGQKELDTLVGVVLPVFEFTPLGRVPNCLYELEITIDDQTVIVEVENTATNVPWTSFVATSNIEFLLREHAPDGQIRTSQVGTIEIETARSKPELEHPFVVYVRDSLNPFRRLDKAFMHEDHWYDLVAKMHQHHPRKVFTYLYKRR